MKIQYFMYVFINISAHHDFLQDDLPRYLRRRIRGMAGYLVHGERRCEVLPHQQGLADEGVSLARCLLLGNGSRVKKPLPGSSGPLVRATWWTPPRE